MHRITVVVDEDGNLLADFSGFMDRTCEGEEESFRKLMAGFGLKAQAGGRRRKSGAEIQGELGAPAGPRGRGAVRG